MLKFNKMDKDGQYLELDRETRWTQEREEEMMVSDA
jgi:hypothetical protein